MFLPRPNYPGWVLHLLGRTEPRRTVLFRQSHTTTAHVTNPRLDTLARAIRRFDGLFALEAVLRLRRRTDHIVS